MGITRSGWKGNLFTIAFFLFGMVMTPFAMAGDITIWDGMGTNPGIGSSGENNEVEPNCVQLQKWDIEPSTCRKDLKNNVIPIGQRVGLETAFVIFTSNKW